MLSSRQRTIHRSGSTMQRKQGGKARVFQERTNIPTVSLVPHPKPAVDFELQENQPVNPIVAVAEMQHVAGEELDRRDETITRRSNRYADAEQALTYCFQRSLEQEVPASQLQIVVLQKATSVLHIRISETADSLERLRTMLVDRSLEPQEYQHIQRQRWLEERRLLAAEDLSKALQRSLAATSSTSAQPQAIPSVSSNAKSNTNLLRFLDYPWPRVSITRQYYCRHLRNDNVGARNGISRTHQHKSLLPLTLPTQRRRAPRALPTISPIRIPIPSSFEILDSTSHPSPSLSLTLSSISDLPSTPEATPLPELMPPPPTTLLSLTPFTGATGTATIWQQTLSFSREEILKGLVVSIPDYVNDLLAEFDSAIPADPPLPLEKHDIIMTNRTEFIDCLPTQSEKTSLSSDYSYIPRQQPTPPPPPPPKRRHSIFFDVVSSHLSAPSGDGQMSSRADRRRSSPPSAFPSTVPKASIASNEPSRRTTTRRTSISISDLRSVFSGSASSNGPIATSTPRNSESATNSHQPEQQERANTDKKLLTRLRRRMSFLRRF